MEKVENGDAEDESTERGPKVSMEQVRDENEVDGR